MKQVLEPIHKQFLETQSSLGGEIGECNEGGWCYRGWQRHARLNFGNHDEGNGWMYSFSQVETRAFEMTQRRDGYSFIFDDIRNIYMMYRLPTAQIPSACVEEIP
jgi:hypothetical protein